MTHAVQWRRVNVILALNPQAADAGACGLSEEAYLLLNAVDLLLPLSYPTELLLEVGVLGMEFGVYLLL